MKHEVEDFFNLGTLKGLNLNEGIIKAETCLPQFFRLCQRRSIFLLIDLLNLYWGRGIGVVNTVIIRIT